MKARSNAWRSATILCTLMAIGALAGCSQEQDPAAALRRTYGCMSCHGMVRKQVGPGFAQIAERYRGDPEALPRTAARIRGGSVGEWGRVIMPRQPRMTEAESRLLAAWVLSQPPAK